MFFDYHHPFKKVVFNQIIEGTEPNFNFRKNVMLSTFLH